MSQYPKRLYMNGEVTADETAANSVVVGSAGEEEKARAQGYRKAWEGRPEGVRLWGMPVAEVKPELISGVTIASVVGDMPPAKQRAKRDADSA